MRCLACGTQLDPTPGSGGLARQYEPSRCPHCGADQRAPSAIAGSAVDVRCWQCGAGTDAAAPACRRCGAVLHPPEMPDPAGSVPPGVPWMAATAPAGMIVTSPGPQAARESVLTPGLKTFLLAVAIVVLLAAAGVVAGELVR